MAYRRYLIYDIFGGLLWVHSMVLGGYFLGRSVPNINQHIHWVIAVVVFLSILPGIIGVWRARRRLAEPPRAQRSSVAEPRVD